MSLDILETFPNVQVVFYRLSPSVEQLLKENLQGCGARFLFPVNLDELNDNLQDSKTSLVLFGSSDDEQCVNELNALESLIDPRLSILVVCYENLSALNSSLLEFDVVADTLDLSSNVKLIQRKCGLCLELLQRRDLFGKEERLINQLAYQKNKLLSVLPDGVLSVTSDGSLVDINDSALEVLGYGREELVGAHLSQLLCEPSSTDPLLDWCDHPIYSVITTQQNESVEDTGLWRSDGSKLPVDCEIATLYPGQEPEYLIVFQDISIRKTEEAQLNQLTRYDPVTGLANVSLMRHFLLKAMARALRNDRRLAVLYIDLDDFHCINESFGMSGGNSLLKSVGRRIKNCIRTGDLVSRYQDDAFMVVLDEVRHDSDVEKVAKQIMEKLNTPHDLSGVPVVSHASIGISFYPQGSIGIDVLIEQATQAMQWVKLHGKNNLHVAGSDKHSSEGFSTNAFMH